MRFILKGAVITLAIVLFFGLGVWLTHQFYQKQIPNVEEQSQVLLERIKAVTKFITVEGYFSELYNYKDYYSYDIVLLRKKALLRVKAKVSVGYDLSNLKLEALSEQKTIVISNLPDPEILSIDHDIDYYDVQEGLFNSFSSKDYSKLNKNAKNFIYQKAKESDLFLAAEEQSNQMLEVIKMMVESAGWKVKYETRLQSEYLND